MDFMLWIRQRIVDVAQIFVDLYFEVSGWVWPFHLMADFFLDLYFVFIELARHWLDFEDWVDHVITKLGEILSTWDIWSFFEWWFTAAENAWNWVETAITNVTNIVDVWWGSVSQDVMTWVNDAKLFAQALVTNVEASLNNLQTTWDNFWTLTWPQWTASLTSLQTTWDNFWTITFPTLATWSGVTSLVTTTLTIWFPFHDELVALWDSIVDFFTDPLEFLWTRFTDWFLGPEV